MTTEQWAQIGNCILIVLSFVINFFRSSKKSVSKKLSSATPTIDQQNEITTSDYLFKVNGKYYRSSQVQVIKTSDFLVEKLSTLDLNSSDNAQIEKKEE